MNRKHDDVVPENKGIAADQETNRSEGEIFQSPETKVDFRVSTKLPRASIPHILRGHSAGYHCLIAIERMW